MPPDAHEIAAASAPDAAPKVRLRMLNHLRRYQFSSRWWLLN